MGVSPGRAELAAYRRNLRGGPQRDIDRGQNVSGIAKAIGTAQKKSGRHEVGRSKVGRVGSGALKRNEATCAPCGGTGRPLSPRVTPRTLIRIKAAKRRMAQLINRPVD